MGFDLVSLEPTKKEFSSWRNNVWWWRPLNSYISSNCENILTEKDKIGCTFNDGHKISKTKAIKIGQKLKKLVEEGKTKEYEEWYKEELDKMPDEKCSYCKGTGKRNTEKCNVCAGKGEVRPFATWYPFSEENVKEFIRFCMNSGGFEVW